MTIRFRPGALGALADLAGRALFADQLAAACAALGLRPRALGLLPFEFADGGLLAPPRAAAHSPRTILERRHSGAWQSRFEDVLARDVAIGSVHRPELARALSSQMSPPAEALARRAIWHSSNYPFRIAIDTCLLRSSSRTLG